MLTERTFDNGFITVNYAEGPPNGGPLVTAHGSTARWQELGPLLAGLVDDWQVFACDARGHGTSSWGQSYGVSEFAADISAFIEGRIGGPAVLIGHSGGALASLAAAAATPELIRSLVVIDPPLFLREESVRSKYVYGYFQGVFDLRTGQLTADQFFDAIFPDMPAEERRTTEVMLSTLDPASVRAHLDDLFLDLDLTSALEAIRSATLMLYGEIDKGGLVTDRDASYFTAHVANGIATQIKDAGHLPFLDQPERTLELIRAFLAG